MPSERPCSVCFRAQWTIVKSCRAVSPRDGRGEVKLALTRGRIDGRQKNKKHPPISYLYQAQQNFALRKSDKWATTWQNQQSDCAPSEDSDQPGHPPSLIRVFAVRMKKPWVLSYPLSAQRRLWSDWADAQADLSFRWAHTHFVGTVMSWLKLGLSWQTEQTTNFNHFYNLL